MMGLTTTQKMQMRRAVCDIIGAPWKLLGREPAGLDCLGMVLWLYAQAGVDLPDPALSRGEMTDAPMLAERFSRLPDHATPETGDVVQFATGQYGTHLAIYFDGNLLQATEDHGVVQVPLKRFAAARQGVAFDWYRYASTGRRMGVAA